MSLVAVGHREGSYRPDALRPVHPVAWAMLVAVACFIGYEMPRLWSVHINDATVRPSLETGIAAAAIVGVILLVARFRQTRLLRDLLLLTAFGAIALNGFAFHALPAYGLRTRGYGAGAGIAMTVLAAAAFAAVSFVPAQRRVAARARRSLGLAALATVAWILLGEAFEVAAGLFFGRGAVDLDSPIWTVMALLCFVLLLASGVRSAHGSGAADTEARLLTGAAILLAGAELATLGMPVAPADWVAPDDALRVGAFALLIAVSVVLYRQSQRQMAQDALAAERLRIAGDLHDGLAQDLAFIAAHSDRLGRVLGANHPVAIAAARALATSRGQIVDLEASSAPSTAAALHEVAAEARARYDVRITVRLQATNQPEPSPAERVELVRIAREAIANAVRHGRAKQITVTLGSRHEPFLLRVTDDGSGLPAPGQPAGSTAGAGLGMRAMGDRARRIGAQLRANRREHGGTEIDVAPISTSSEVEQPVHAG
jgi:signal transduction histidine kinase